MPIISNAVSETIFFGPYRTTFNVPAEITIAFDKEKVTNPTNILQYYNEVIESFRFIQGQKGYENKPNLEEYLTFETWYIHFTAEFE